MQRLNQLLAFSRRSGVDGYGGLPPDEIALAETQRHGGDVDLHTTAACLNGTSGASHNSKTRRALAVFKKMCPAA